MECQGTGVLLWWTESQLQRRDVIGRSTRLDTLSEAQCWGKDMRCVCVESGRLSQEQAAERQIFS
jgi:hypothetical protein